MLPFRKPIETGLASNLSIDVKYKLEMHKAEPIHILYVLYYFESDEARLLFF